MQALSHRGGLGGCFSSHMLLLAQTTVARVPNDVSDREASIVNCAMAGAVHAVSRLPTERMGTTAVVQVRRH